MARRRDTPPVARPAGKRFFIELGKDILIVALSCSAILLAWQTPMISHLRGWVTPATQTAGPTVVQSGQAVTPYAVAVRNHLGLYGVSYDEGTVGRVFDSFSPHLRQALASAGDVVSMSPEQWRSMLEAPGVCCLFQGSPSLTALAASLGGESAPEGAGRMVVLCRLMGRMWLGWQEGKDLYRAPVALGDEEGWQGALDDYGPNGAAYAYDLAAQDDAYDALDPWVLISLAPSQPTVYAASTPDFISDATALGDLLASLGFLSGADAAYETAGGLAISENGDRLQVSRAGEILFRAGEETRYPAGGRARGVPGEREAVLSAWEVLTRCAESWKEAGEFVLTATAAVDNGWEITFQTRLAGVPVLMGEKGWCARFLVAEGKVTEFTVYPRTYVETEEVSLIATPRLAAAALRSLPGNRGKLLLCYTDNRSAALTAGWLCEE